MAVEAQGGTASPGGTAARRQPPSAKPVTGKKPKNNQNAKLPKAKPK
jgi:hypothetical protein